MYDSGDLIGGGSFSVVSKSKTSTGETVALKEISLRPNEGIPSSCLREISILKKLKHDNIVRLRDVVYVKEKPKLQLVFEYIQFDMKKKMNAVDNSDFFTPEVVKAFLHKILVAVAFCHSHDVLHRDLKPQNILINADGNDLKIADFGLARLHDLRRENFTPKVVTLNYRAPEILLGSSFQSDAVDMWSVGCIFAEMVNNGNIFFNGDTEIAVLSNIVRVLGTPNKSCWPTVQDLPAYEMLLGKNVRRQKFSEAIYGDLEESGKNLLSKMLRWNPGRRITAERALQHKYFQLAP